ncbi:MAG: hypothetical protein QG604_122, partial [Candidatus Dependentiae bacterium]|nr:hypothetical protein [Candidatus Dependentiae bacterium]
ATTPALPTAVTPTAPALSSLPALGKAYTTQADVDTDITAADTATVNAGLAAINAARLAYTAALYWASCADLQAKSIIADTGGTTSSPYLSLQNDATKGTTTILALLKGTPITSLMQQLTTLCPSFPESDQTSITATAATTSTDPQASPGSTAAANAVAVQTAAHALINQINTTIIGNIPLALQAIKDAQIPISITTASQACTKATADAATAATCAANAVTAAGSVVDPAAGASAKTVTVGSTAVAVSKSILTTAATVLRNSNLAANVPAASTIPTATAANAQASADTITNTAAGVSIQAALTGCSSVLICAMAVDLKAQDAIAAGAPATLRTDATIGTQSIIAAINTQYQQMLGAPLTVSMTCAIPTTFTSVAINKVQQSVAGSVLATLTGSITTNLNSAINAISIAKATAACSVATASTTTASSYVDNAVKAAGQIPTTKSWYGYAGNVSIPSVTQSALAASAATLKSSTGTPHGATQLTSDVPATSTIPAATAANATATADGIAKTAAIVTVQAALNVCSAALICAIYADIQAQIAMGLGASSTLQTDSATGTKSFINAINTQFQKLCPSQTISYTSTTAPSYTSTANALTAQAVAVSVINTVSGSITTGINTALGSISGFLTGASITTATNLCTNTGTDVSIADSCISTITTLVTKALSDTTWSIPMGSSSVSCKQSDLIAALGPLKTSTKDPRGTTQLKADIPASSTIPAATVANAQSIADGISNTAAGISRQAAYDACSAALIWALYLDTLGQAAIALGAATTLQTDTTSGTRAILASINTQFQRIASATTTVSTTPAIAQKPVLASDAVQAENTAGNVIVEINGSITTRLYCNHALMAIAAATTDTTAAVTLADNAKTAIGKLDASATWSSTIGSAAVSLSQSALLSAATTLKTPITIPATSSLPSGTAITAASAPTDQPTVIATIKAAAKSSMQAALNACSAALICALYADVQAQNAISLGAATTLQTDATIGTTTLISTINTKFQQLVPSQTVSYTSATAPDYTSVASALTAQALAETVLAAITSDIVYRLNQAVSNINDATQQAVAGLNTASAAAASGLANARKAYATAQAIAQKASDLISTVTTAYAATADNAKASDTTSTATKASLKSQFDSLSGPATVTAPTVYTATPPADNINTLLTFIKANSGFIASTPPKYAKISDANAAQTLYETYAKNAAEYSRRAAIALGTNLLLWSQYTDMQAQTTITKAQALPTSSDNQALLTQAQTLCTDPNKAGSDTPSIVKGLKGFLTTIPTLPGDALGFDPLTMVQNMLSILQTLSTAVSTLNDKINTAQQTAITSATGASLSGAQKAYSTAQSDAQAASTLLSKAVTAVTGLADGTASADSGSTLSKTSLQAQITTLSGPATVSTPTTYTSSATATDIKTTLALVTANKGIVPAAAPTYTGATAATADQKTYNGYTQDAINYSRIAAINACNVALILAQCADLQAQTVIAFANALTASISTKSTLVANAQAVRTNSGKTGTSDIISAINTVLTSIPTSSKTYTVDDQKTYDGVITTITGTTDPAITAAIASCASASNAISTAQQTAITSSLTNAQTAYSTAQSDAQAANTLLSKATTAVTGLADGAASTDSGSTLSKTSLQAQITALSGPATVSTPTTYTSSATATDIKTTLALVTVNKGIVPSTTPTYTGATGATAAQADQKTYNGYTQDAINYSRIAAINACNVALILAQCADLQAQKVVASANALPASVSTKSTLVTNAQAVRTNSSKTGTSDIISTINTTLASIPTSSKTYTLDDQKTYDGVITTITSTTDPAITAAIASCTSAGNAVSDATPATNAGPTATSLANAQTAYTIAQTDAQAASTLIGKAATAVTSLPDGATGTISGSTVSKTSLQTQLTPLSGPATVTPPTAYTATPGANDISTILATVTANKSLIPTTAPAYAGSTGTAAATKDKTTYDGYAQHAINYSRMAAINVCNATLILAQCADLQAQAVVTAATALPSKLSIRSTLLNNAQALRTNSGKTGTADIITAVTTTLASIPTTAKTYTSDDQKTYDSIITAMTGTTVPAIATAVTAITPVNTAVAQVTPPAADLPGAIVGANKSVKSALDAAIAAKPAAQTADSNALAVVVAAKALTNRHELLGQAQNLQNNSSTTPASGTGPNLTYITQVVATLQKAPSTYTNIDAANTAKSQADAAKVAIDGITTNTTALLAKISSLQSTIAAAQRTVQPTSSSGTSLDSLNVDLAAKKQNVSTALSNANSQATDALSKATKAITDAEKLQPSPTGLKTQKEITKVQNDIKSLKTSISELSTKITATQKTLNKILLPFSDQAAAMNAKPIVENSASYAKTATSLLAQYVNSINALQKTIAGALPK